MEPGIYNLTRAEYDKLDAVNASLLKACSRSMAHGKAYLDGHRKETDAMAFGTGYHKYILERAEFDRDYFVIPKMRRAGKVWDEQCDLAGERSIIFDEDVAEFERMRGQLVAEAGRRRLTTEAGMYEVCVVWKDADTGIACKGLIDKVVPSLQAAVDLKTTTDARDFAFFKAAANFGYDLQAAMYLDGIEAVKGERYDFAFLAQETDAPYLAAMYTVTNGEDAHQIGRCKYRALLKRLAKCEESGVWPGYEHHTRELVVPEWSVPEEIKSGAFA